MILCMPRKMHACKRLPASPPASVCAGGDSALRRLKEGEAVVELQKKTGLVAMCGHTRRFNPSHRWVHKKIKTRGIQHPADGCADSLFPPHQHECTGPAAELDRPSVSGIMQRIRWISFAYQCGGPIVQANAVRGADPSGAGHRNGHVDPAEGGQRGDLCPLALIQQ